MTLKEYLTAHEGEKGLPETLHTITPEQANKNVEQQKQALKDGKMPGQN